MERALKSGQRQGVQAPAVQGLQKAPQAASARVQESAAMEVENREPVKRPLPADEGVNAKRHRNTTTIQRTVHSSREDYLLLEIVPKRKDEKNKGLGLPPLLIQTQRSAASAQLIVVGDFNAPHLEWGYIRASPKGNRLWQVARDLRWTLLNNPQDHTKIGNNISMDTSSDLTFLKGISNPKWVNTGQTLGSGHYILSTTFIAAKHKAKVKGHKVAEWDRFRKTRADTVNGEIEDLDAWVEALKQDVKSTTVEVPIEE
ncbi:hypothetical protein HPB52_020598 [Rhipicephalus sanguineus]|uniref:Endonuclease/exonuclease/phosphatase domain-containing protein n=1 Tax=Rhipicephalus sanguineus TaxID=34632 RepID=A0A9D4PYM2_RHISA|nr:hypothetical protein HPB52_020598 [Rhipicephalus sanguineus]